MTLPTGLHVWGLGSVPPVHPSPRLSRPAQNLDARYYWESYVWEDPTWTLVTNGWLDISENPQQAYGSGQMLMAQYNLPGQTRVWDQDSGAWLAWNTATPVGWNPDTGVNPMAPAAAPTTSSSGWWVAAGLGLAAIGTALWISRR